MYERNLIGLSSSSIILCLIRFHLLKWYLYLAKAGAYLSNSFVKSVFCYFDKSEFWKTTGPHSFPLISLAGSYNSTSAMLPILMS